jgi:hypothetical protein
MHTNYYAAGYTGGDYPVLRDVPMGLAGPQNQQWGYTAPTLAVIQPPPYAPPAAACSDNVCCSCSGCCTGTTLLHLWGFTALIPAVASVICLIFVCIGTPEFDNRKWLTILAALAIIVLTINVVLQGLAVQFLHLGNVRLLVKAAILLLSHLFLSLGIYVSLGCIGEPIAAAFGVIMSVEYICTMIWWVNDACSFEKDNNDPNSRAVCHCRDSFTVIVSISAAVVWATWWVDIAVIWEDSGHENQCIPLLLWLAVLFIGVMGCQIIVWVDFEIFVNVRSLFILLSWFFLLTIAVITFWIPFEVNILLLNMLLFVIPFIVFDVIWLSYSGCCKQCLVKGSEEVQDSKTPIIWRASYGYDALLLISGILTLSGLIICTAKSYTNDHSTESDRNWTAEHIAAISLLATLILGIVHWFDIEELTIAMKRVLHVHLWIFNVIFAICGVISSIGINKCSEHNNCTTSKHVWTICLVIFLILDGLWLLHTLCCKCLRSAKNKHENSVAGTSDVPEYSGNYLHSIET